MCYIAICDDEQTELYKANALLSRYRETHLGCDFTVESFSSTHALYDKIRTGVIFDLLLLDIYMPDKTGIEVARELRKRGFEGQIIFLTTSKEHAAEAFDVDASQYLIKPVEQERFFTVLYKVLGRLSGEHKGYLALRADGEVRRLPVRSIIYSESQNQYQLLYCTDNEKIRVRMTVTKLYEALRINTGFVRVGSTYIVNLGYVDSLNAKVMKLAAGKEIGKEIRLPRGSYSVLKKQYFAYYLGGREE